MTDNNEDTEVTAIETVEAPKVPQPKKPRKPRTPSVKKLKLDNTGGSTSNVEVASFTVATSLTRPLTPPVNSIVYETDTGNRVRFNGTGWDHIDNLS